MHERHSRCVLACTYRLELQDIAFVNVRGRRLRLCTRPSGNIHNTGTIDAC